MHFNDEDDDSSSPSGDEEVGEGERDDVERNSAEETLPLDNFFLSPNQNLESTTDWYRDVGKDYVKNIDGNVNVCLAYAYDTPPSRVGKENQFFFLTSMATLVTKKVDILHHAQASLKESHSCPSAAFRLRTVFVVFEDHRPNASQYHILV